MSERIHPDLLQTTAYWTASVRACESERTDGLFHDPWAAALAGATGAAWMAQRTADSVIPIILRTRFFDDFLQRISQQQGIRQIVFLAAGLDTRAFRLPWPAETQLFELDRPELLAYKQEILAAAGAQPSCVRHSLPVDLTGPWAMALRQAGFATESPALWLLEGFLFYLSNEQTAQIQDEIATLAAPGSWIGFDVVNSEVYTSPLTRRWVEMQANSGAPWIGTLDDPEAFLAERGWHAVLTQAGAPDAHYGRWPYPVIPTKMPHMPHNWLVTAQKVSS